MHSYYYGVPMGIDSPNSHNSPIRPFQINEVGVFATFNCNADYRVLPYYLHN